MFAAFIKRWFHVVVVQWMSKKCFKSCDAHADCCFAHKTNCFLTLSWLWLLQLHIDLKNGKYESY